MTQLIQVPSIFLVERVQNRRAICVYASIVGRVAWLFIALIPLLFTSDLGLKLFIVAVMFHGVFTAITHCGWNSWMRDLLPQDRLGAFFYKRMSLSLGLGMALSLAAGIFIDRWKGPSPSYEFQGYSVIFSIGFVAGMLGVYTISTILGGKFADIFERYEFSWTLKWIGPGKELAFQALDFFFAFLIGLYSIHRLTKVKEAGRIKEKIAVQDLVAEIQGEMRNVSTAGLG